MIIDETQKGEDLNLRLRNCIPGPQGIQNMVPDRQPRDRPKIETPINAISPLTFISTVPAAASPSFQLQSQSIPHITKDQNRNSQREKAQDFENSPTI
jgi:hypothetical protein